MSHDELPRLRLLETVPHEEGETRGLLLVDPEGVFEGQVFVPEGLLPVVAQFAGDKSCAEIAQELSRQFEQDVTEDFVAGIAAELRKKHCLEGPELELARNERLAEYRGLPARPATSAGSAGYPAEPDACRARLDAIVEAPAAPRDLDGLVAPHIDLERGEAGYRAAYGALAGSRPAELYVVFGTGHRASERPLVPTLQRYATPIGVTEIASELEQVIGDTLGDSASAAPIWNEEIRHLNEHSVEFQALFLRHRHLLAQEGAAAVEEHAPLLAPLLTGYCEDATRSDELARTLDAMAEWIRRFGVERTMLVAGVDLAHLGPFFGDVAPVSDEQLQQLEEEDRASLQLYAEGRFDEFWRDVEGASAPSERNPRRICGTMSMYCVGKLRERLGLSVESELLHYGQAVAPDRSQVVSFAAMAYWS
jgi:AmmeMemoRadiSam system protein B